MVIPGSNSDIIDVDIGVGRRRILFLLWSMPDAPGADGSIHPAYRTGGARSTYLPHTYLHTYLRTRRPGVRGSEF